MGIPDHENIFRRKFKTRKLYNTKFSRSTVYPPPPHMLHTSEIKKGKPNYRIVGNFQWKKTFAKWWKYDFRGENLRGLLVFCRAKGCHAPNFAEKTFAYSNKTVKFMKVFSLKSSSLYSIWSFAITQTIISRFNNTTSFACNRLYWYATALDSCDSHNLIKNTCFMPAYLHGYPHTMT